MAAAWVIASGPLAPFAAAVIAIAILVIKNWDKITVASEELWEDVKEIFGKIKEFVVDVFGAIVDAIKKAIDCLTSWNDSDIKDKSATVTTYHNDVTHTTSEGMRSSHNAQGTNFWRGGLTSINEEGGEILDLPRGTRIIPHDVSMAMASSGGASSGVTFGYGAFAGANIMDDYGVDRLMDRVIDRLALKGVK